MKTSRYRALLTLETSQAGRLAVFGVFGAQAAMFGGNDAMGDAPLFALVALFGGFAISLAYGFIFQEGTFGFPSRETGAGRSLEFPFSRAIDRADLYRVRVISFLVVGLVPFLAMAVASCWHPDRTITRYATARAAHPEIDAYYLRSFPGAAVKSEYAFYPKPGMVPQSIPRKITIILPGIRLEQALVLTWLGLAAAAVLQALMLGTLRHKWCQRLLPTALFTVPPMALLLWDLRESKNNPHAAEPAWQPPALDQLVAWAVRHPWPLLGAGALLVAATIHFGSRQFVRQEVLP